MRLSKLLLVLPILLLHGAAIAQSGNFPNKPVRLIASFSPGGSVGVTARLLGGKASD